jgi:hypothetical protein
MKVLPPNDSPEARAKRRAQHFYLNQQVSVWTPHEERYVSGYTVTNTTDQLGRVRLRTPHSKQTIHVLAFHVIP